MNVAGSGVGRSWIILSTTVAPAASASPASSSIECSASSFFDRRRTRPTSAARSRGPPSRSARRHGVASREDAIYFENSSTRSHGTRRRERVPARRRSRRRSWMEAPRVSGPHRSAHRCRSPNDAHDALRRRGWRIAGEIGARRRDGMPGTARQRPRHGVCGHANGHFSRRKMHVVAQCGDAGMISVSGPGQPREASRAASGVIVPT